MFNSLWFMFQSENPTCSYIWVWLLKTLDCQSEDIYWQPSYESDIINHSSFLYCRSTIIMAELVWTMNFLSCEGYFVNYFFYLDNMCSKVDLHRDYVFPGLDWNSHHSGCTGWSMKTFFNLQIPLLDNFPALAWHSDKLI